MKKFYSIFYGFAFLLLINISASAQRNYFSDVSEMSIQAKPEARVIVPQKFRSLQINASALKDFLWSLPAESQILRNRTAAPILNIPMPDGSTARFHVWESSIQEAGLEAKFPEIKTFAGQGIDDPTATIRFDFNPYFGFRAQILSSVTGRIYIDPYANKNIDYVISYYHTDNIKPFTINCQVEDPLIGNRGNNPIPDAAACRGTDLRTYRLAVACTGEYAQATGIAAGTNPAILHAAIVTTVNRVVGVYEKEISVRLILVASNNLVEFLDATTDPFNGNTNANILINESQTVMTNFIGAANYDIGHTFSTGGGGLAQLNSPCGSSKARGITGSSQPTGDGYDIDYVAHEMGHQFGGNHTMAGCGSSPNNTKLEPGGGTTIQAYAGICGAQDLQAHSDPFFHSISFDEISNFLTVGNGSSCGTSSPTGNTIPIIAALTNNNLSIPVNTPFVLNGTATDADGDALTYSWEEWDQQGTQNWNSGLTGAAGNTIPLFRVRNPKTTGERIFPDPRIIAANYPTNPAVAMNGLKGEILSPVARPMKFKLTVRDNKASGGGVASSGTEGCQTNTIFQVNVVGAAPFTVISPNGGESYPGNTTQNITWDVAGTNAAPFNVANVKISLSVDGGLTFPTVIAANTPNDGTEAVNIPNMPSTTARIKVEAINNIFFDISNQNFTITMAVAGFSFASPAPVNVPCNGASTAGLTLGSNSIGGYVTPINLTATSGVPAGTTVTFTPTMVVPGNSTVVTLNNVNTLTPGNYNITVSGTSGTSTQTRIVTFTVATGTAPTITAQPASVALCAGGNAVFNVTATGAISYQWQVSTDGGASYINVPGQITPTLNVNNVTALQTNYRYRVLVNSQCGVATSNAAILTVQTAPVITTQPQSTVVCVGVSATFTSVATGTGLTYQWQISTTAVPAFTNITGATAASYTQTGVSLVMNNNKYRVIVSGTCAPAVTSSEATLTVGNSAAITTNPVSTTVCVGDNANFTVTASGSSLTFQWQVSTNGGTSFTNITGANSATLSLPAVTAAQNGYQYRAVVFSCAPTGVNSSVATLTVNNPLLIQTQPQSVTLCQGLNTTLSVAATGTGLTYQWQISTNGGTTFANITGATAATLDLLAVTPAMNGNVYRVVLKGACNTVGLNSANIVLTVNTLVAISAQPTATSVCLPNNTSFSLTAAGTGLTYQWQVSTNNGTSYANITGATSSTLSLTGITIGMNGNLYRAVLTGICNNITSNAVMLTVNNPVNITTQPVNTAVCESKNVQFTVVATGSTITYQWQVSVNNGPFVNIANDANYSGATSANLTIANTTVGFNGYKYRVVVSGVPCGILVSNDATLTVNRLPAVVLNVSSNTAINPYTPAEAYVTVSPPGNYTYNWTLNGQPLPGQTGNSFLVNVDGAGEYQVTVTDQVTGCGTTSNKSVVTLKQTDGIFIYPNPSKGLIQVRYYQPNTQLPSTSTVSVYDSKGSRVSSGQYTATINYGRMDVDLSRMAPGIYMVEIQNEGKRVVSGKVIIQH